MAKKKVKNNVAEVIAESIKEDKVSRESEVNRAISKHAEQIYDLKKRIDRIVDAHESCKSLKGL